MSEFQETYNVAIGRKYESQIRALIRKYYVQVSETAIEDFLSTGNFAELTAEQLLAQSGFFFRELEPSIEKVATEFVIKIETKSNAAFRKAYIEAKTPIPEQLRQVRLSNPTQNLISQQVNKIKTLCDYQYQKINEATQQAIVQNMGLNEYKELLRESKLYNEKRIKIIAQNQLHFATNITNINKAQELDLTHGIWIHPKNLAIYKTHPRPSHVEADGKVFKLDKGCKIDGDYIYPSQLPNCRCSWKVSID